MPGIVSLLTGQRSLDEVIADISAFAGGSRDIALISNLRAMSLCLYRQRIPEDFKSGCLKEAEEFSVRLISSFEIGRYAALWPRQNVEERIASIKAISGEVMKQFSRAYRVEKGFGIELTFDEDKSASAKIAGSGEDRIAVINIDRTELANIEFPALLGLLAHELIHANQLHNFEELKSMPVAIGNLVQAALAVSAHDEIYIDHEEDAELYAAQLCENEGRITQERVEGLYKLYQQEGRKR